jgi:(S)-3,5-dihydroxyphenylglycine transaminase
MRYFYPEGGGTHQIRLSFSVLTPARIEEGLARLAALVRDRTA